MNQIALNKSNIRLKLRNLCVFKKYFATLSRGYRRLNSIEFQDTRERCRLLMELSLFDVDFIEHSLDSKSAAQRFNFALSTLQVLHLLYANEHSQFIRKATLYCIETIAKTVAVHIRR